MSDNAGIMELINVYESSVDHDSSEEVLDEIIVKVMHTERCSEPLAIEFAYMLKLAKANDGKLPGEYMLKRMFGFLAFNMRYQTQRENG